MRVACTFIKSDFGHSLNRVNSTYWIIFHVFLSSADLFLKSFIFRKFLPGIRSINMDPDQVRCFVGPDLSPNYF